jgi:cAMP-dependent protein kinase regulator
MMVKASIQQRTMKAGFLDQMKIFANLDRFQKLKLIDALTSKSYKDGEMIFNEGDEGKEFYIIEKGECDCLK